jgi:hypothetical protein
MQDSDQEKWGDSKLVRHINFDNVLRSKSLKWRLNIASGSDEDFNNKKNMDQFRINSFEQTNTVLLFIYNKIVSTYCYSINLLL